VRSFEIMAMMTGLEFSYSRTEGKVRRKNGAHKRERRFFCQPEI
jgi:hypothetical protein